MTGVGPLYAVSAPPFQENFYRYVTGKFTTYCIYII